jgi:hypothetical protein
MQASIQISIAVSPSALGEFVVMLLKMLIRTRNSVIKSAIRPKKIEPSHSSKFQKYIQGFFAS